MRGVLVTGATGFVGRALCQRLVEQGWRVRAAVRERSSAAVVLPATVDASEVGDLEDRPDWTEALEGMDLVVHLAGRVPTPGAEPDPGSYERTNVGASVELARAAASAGIRRMVFVSSVKVLGDHSGSRPLRSDDPPRPADAYARSKLAAERALQDILAGESPELVIVRAPLVYGPGAGGNFLRLTEAVLSGQWLPVGAISARRSMICVDGLCEFLERCLEHPGAVGTPLLVADPEDLAVAELVQRLGCLLQRRPRIVPVPAAVLRAVGLITGRSDEVRRLVEPLQVDLSATRQRLQWQPADPSECLAATVKWLLNARAESGG